MLESAQLNKLGPGCQSSGFLFRSLLEVNWMTRLGIVLVTHVTEISEGLVQIIARGRKKMLTSQLERVLMVAEIGTSFKRIQVAFDAN